MADPLSIISGVAGVLSVCIKASWALKEFYDGVSIVDAKARGLVTEVESFGGILQLLKDTLEQEKIRNSFQATGFISNLWNSMATSIFDSQTTIIQLQQILEKANKTVRTFDATRKHLRLRGSVEEISIYQQQIRSYRETLQLSLQAVVLWNHVTLQESTDRISPNLDELNNTIRRMASDIHSSIESLRSSVESTKTKDDIRVLSNLENCIRSSASVVSSTSTIVGNGAEENSSRQYGSEFGDVLPSQPGEMLSRWAISSTIFEFEEPQSSHSQTAEWPSAGAPLSSVQQGVEPEDDTIDSDTELEEATVLALLKRGKQRLAEDDFQAAERHFQNFLNRLSAIRPSIPTKRILNIDSEVTPLLIVAFCRQKKLDAAQSLLMERITNPPNPQDSHEVLFGKSEYSEALLYGRRALKGYWKLGSNGSSEAEKVLKLLIRICHEDGNIAEEDAYTAILAEFEERNASRSMEESLPHLDVMDASQPRSEAKAAAEVKHYDDWNAIFAELNAPAASNPTSGESMRSFAETDSRTPRREPQQVGNGLSFQELMWSMKPDEPQDLQSDPNVLNTRPLSAMFTPPRDQSTPKRFRFSADDFLKIRDDWPLRPPAYPDTSNTSTGGDIRSPGNSSQRPGLESQSLGSSSTSFRMAAAPGPAPWDNR